jgi:hypothetical protein
MSRSIGGLVAVVLLALLGVAARADAQSARVALIDHRQPTFFSCVTAVPYPPTTPPGARQHADQRLQACGGTGSGFTLVVRIDDGSGSVPAGKNVVQTVFVKGSLFTINAATGKCDKQKKFRYLLPEYFDNPPGRPTLDHHITVECCEIRYQSDVTVATALLPLPAGSRPRPGFNAGYPYTTADEMKAIIDAIADNPEAIWGHNYAHDTCNRPRQTPSGTVHWMQYNLEYPTIGSGIVVTGN